MRIVYADDSHEMTSIIFSEKYIENQNVVCCSCNWRFYSYILKQLHINDMDEKTEKSF